MVQRFRNRNLFQNRFAEYGDKGVQRKVDGNKEDRDSCDIVYILWLKVLNTNKDKIR